MLHHRCDPRLRLRSQGDHSMCINSVPISLRAIAPWRTYRLSDILTTAQMSRVVIVLQQLTRGWSQRVAPIARPESSTFSRAWDKPTPWPSPWVDKFQTCPLCVVGTPPITPISFHALSWKPATTDALSDIVTFPKMDWLHGQFWSMLTLALIAPAWSSQL